MPRYDFTMTMRNELKQRWINALRSGKYEQTTGYLQAVKSEYGPDGPTGEHTTVGYCCLGVLCDISEMGSWQPRYVDDNSLFWGLNNTSDMNNQTLTDEMRAEFGLNYEDCEFLMESNDNENWTNGLSFNEIADALEAGYYQKPCEPHCYCTDCEACTCQCDMCVEQ